jgi:hypothetical protein
MAAPFFPCRREFARARGVEAEGDDRLAGALVEAGLRIGEVAAGDQDAFFDQVGSLPLAARALEDFGLRRWPCLHRLLGAHRLVDHAEIKLGGLAQKLLEALRVLQAGHLHQDAVDALALDQRLDRTELVDAALDDLDRLLDRLAHALDDRRLGQRERYEPAANIDDVDRALAGGAQDSAERLRELPQFGQPLLQIGFTDAHLDNITPDDRDALQTHARITQHAARPRATVRASPAHRRGVDPSRMCDPPCRSSPSTRWRCAHLGQLWMVFSGKKLGTAHRQKMNAVSRIAIAFQREM